MNTLGLVTLLAILFAAPTSQTTTSKTPLTWLEWSSPEEKIQGQKNLVIHANSQRAEADGYRAEAQEARDASGLNFFQRTLGYENRLTRDADMYEDYANRLYQSAELNDSRALL